MSVLSRLWRFLRTSSSDEARPVASDQNAFSVWGERANERQNAARPIVAWSDSPIVLRQYVHPRISGLPDSNWLDWAARRFFSTPTEVVLGIGSGDGALERHGLAVGLARRFEAFDASDGAVDLARRLAEEHGVDDRLHYEVADLNTYCFKTGHYDAALASMAVHHIRGLEHLFAQVRKALKPGALFIMNEFVGPNQFQWSDRQIKLAEELLRGLPERYRRSLVSGHVKVQIVRQTIAHMNNVDPTEAIRSAEIIPLVREYFDLVEQVDYGGTLLNLVLEEIAGNFADTEEDLAVVRPLFEAEREYITRGAVTSDFTILVARNR